MTRLAWGALGERFFETGADRGVLYVGSNAGVNWDGLISVTHAPSGAEINSQYAGNKKYVNLASDEDFEATIEAFYAPKEFAPCEGNSALNAGIFFTQQSRQAFSFAYRTRIGNDVAGLDYGYKLHLIYNAVVAPLEEEYRTLGDDPEPMIKTWDITTMPSSLTGYKPLAHVVINSTKTPPGMLKAIEDILYGTASTAPRMVMPSELVTMTSSEGPTVRRNIVPNPTFRAAITNFEVRRNYCDNPAFSSAATTGWTIARGTAVVAASTVGPATQVLKYTSSDGTTPNGNYVYYNPNQTIAAGTAIAFSVDVGVAAVGDFKARIQWLAGATHLSYSDGTVTTLQAGTVTRLSAVGTAPATADNFRCHIVATTALPIGVIFEADNVLIEKFGAVLPYFDGSTANSDGLIYSWVSTANGSNSIATGIKPQNWSQLNGALCWRGADGASVRALSVGVGSAGIAFTITAYVTPGETLSFRGDASTDAGGVPAGQLAIVATTPGTNVYAAIYTMGTTKLDNVTIPDTFASLTIRYYMYGPIGTFYTFRNTIVERTPISGEYFDGSTPDANGNFYSWEGPADASASALNTWN